MNILRHVKPGESITAAAWNALIDELASLRKGFPVGGGVPASPLNPSSMVLVRNDTGAALTSRSVVRVDDWVVTPVTYPFEVMQRPALKGNTPNATTNAVAILYDSIRPNEYGRAIVQGIAVCDVLVNDSTHTYARPIANDSAKLGSAASGPARILKWETSGATRRALLLFDAIGDSGVSGTTFSGARVYHNTDQSITAADTALAFNSEDIDTDTYHDTVTNNSRLTVTTAAKYLIGCNIAIYTVGQPRDVQIRLNGTTNIGHWQETDPGSGIDHACIVTPWSCSANDYFEIIVDGAGVPPNDTTIYSITSAEPVFWITRLGV